MIDIDPQDFAHHGLQTLPVAVRIVPRPAVAAGDVEIAVRPEDDGAGVVIPIRLLRRAKSSCSEVGIGAVRIVGRHREPRQHIRVIGRRVIDEKLPVLAELGMKRQAQHSFLRLAIGVDHLFANIQHLARSSTVGSFGNM